MLVYACFRLNSYTNRRKKRGKEVNYALHCSAKDDLEVFINHKKLKVTA